MAHPAKGSPSEPKHPTVPWLVLLAALLAGILIPAAAFILTRPQEDAVPAEAPGPKLSVDRTRIDLGRVPVGKEVEAVFNVRNAGTKSLIIIGQPAVRVVKGC